VAVMEAIGVLVLLGLALLLITVVGRSMVQPLRKLQAGALDVAGRQLPEEVRQMSEAHEGISLEVVPIDVDSSDEIGEVARAFDQVHREALRLAANEAALRANVNAMFVNLSRRSQSLVERQIRLIDDLEQGEQDPERLSSLFQMDHLATRMRRNSENLLVLADHDISKFWNQPVALVDVLRAALSEIEQYERVAINVQPGIAVRGQAVSDVVHLTAELVENATSFSAAETPVTAAGQMLSSGGVLLEITDQGVGIGPEEIAHANWRLDNPPVVDVAVSRRMGLFVVARLAAKHGIRVRLRPAASGGLIALVWLPDETITYERPAASPGMGGSDPAMPETAPGAAADRLTAARWGDLGRAARAEQEAGTGRAPRFVPLRADAEEADPDSPQVPGAGSKSKPMGPVGPWPDFRTVPTPAAEAGAESAETGPRPAAATGSEPVTGSGAGPMAGTDSPATVYQPFRVGAEPADTTTAEPFDGSPLSVAGVSLAGGLSGSGPDRPALGANDPAERSGTGSSDGTVIVPFADSFEEGNRLPIFEAVESDWFRRGGKTVGWAGRDGGGKTVGWASPADDGWRAAEIAHAPSSGGVTSAGLPKRVPQANLVPGAATATAEASAPARSAAATRERFSSFQQGAKKGRAVASDQGAGEGGAESS